MCLCICAHICIYTRLSASYIRNMHSPYIKKYILRPHAYTCTRVHECTHAHPHGNSSDIRVYTQDTLYVTIQPPRICLNKIHAKNVY